MDEDDDLISALRPVALALQALGVRFYVGGSIASSYHGAVRSTMDVDLVCELSEAHVSPFLSLIGTDYYASESAIKGAIRRRSCFNLIHLPTSFKVDLFISRQRSFDLQSFSRAQMGSLGPQQSLSVPIATPEDTIISKLEWYRLTSETSARQWDDVQRVLRLLGDSMDRDYLRQSAASVSVSDLLERLLTQQAG